MIHNSKLSKDPFESTINDLKMFEQTQYCFEYIKQENGNKFLLSDPLYVI